MLHFDWIIVNDEEEIDDEYDIHSHDSIEAFVGVALSFFAKVGWLQFFPHMIDYDSTERPNVVTH